MFEFRIGRIALAGVAATVLVSACSQGGDGGGSDSDLSYEDSPLGQYLGWNEDFDQQDFDDQQLQVEEAVAQCMSEQGFEYIPQTQSSGAAIEESDGEDSNTEEWISQWGYGINKSPEEGAEGAPAVEEGEEFVDPNQGYVDSLSESEQEAYWEALHGPMPSEEDLDEDGSYDVDPENMGCYGDAQAEIGGEDPAQFQDLMDAIGNLYTDLESNPAMVELNTEWANCMADAGQTFDSPNDAIQAVLDESNELYSAGEPEQADIDAAAEREIEIALADFDCQQETDYQNESLKVQFDIEEQFIEENQVALDAYKASLEQGSAG